MNQEDFPDGMAYLVVIWPFEWGPSYSSTLCHHPDGCCWKTRSAFAQMPPWKHCLKADNQIHLLGRGSDSRGSLFAGRRLQTPGKTTEGYLRLDSSTLNGDWILSMTHTASVVLSLLQKAPGGCGQREWWTVNGTGRGLGDCYPSHSQEGCDSTWHHSPFIKTKTGRRSWLNVIMPGPNFNFCIKVK